MHAKLLPLCPTLCYPVSCSLPCSSVQGILQVRKMESVAKSSSRGIFLTQGSKLHLLCVLFRQEDSLPLVLSGKPIKDAYVCIYSISHETMLLVCLYIFSSVQFSSFAQLCPILCDPMSHSVPSLPVHHQLLESTQTHVHRVGDAIQPSHPLSSPSPPALNLSQHQGLFQ